MHNHNGFFNLNHNFYHNIPTYTCFCERCSIRMCCVCSQVVYALLMPASGTLGDDASDFQHNFLKSGGLPLVLGMLTRNNFLPSADMETRRGAYLNALKIGKLLLTGVGFGHVKAVAEACQPLVEGTNPASPVRITAHVSTGFETLFYFFMLM